MQPRELATESERALDRPAPLKELRARQETEGKQESPPAKAGLPVVLSALQSLPQQNHLLHVGFVPVLNSAEVNS